MKNISLVAKKALEKIRLKERQKAHIERLLRVSSKRVPKGGYTGYTSYKDGVALYLDFSDAVLDTAVNLFIEDVEELGNLEFTAEDDYFYYICDFPKYCEALGIKFPDQFKVGKYGKTLENYDG